MKASRPPARRCTRTDMLGTVRQSPGHSQSGPHTTPIRGFRVHWCTIPSGWERWDASKKSHDRPTRRTDHVAQSHAICWGSVAGRPRQGNGLAGNSGKPGSGLPQRHRVTWCNCRNGASCSELKTDVVPDICKGSDCLQRGRSHPWPYETGTLTHTEQPFVSAKFPISTM